MLQGGLPSLSYVSSGGNGLVIVTFAGCSMGSQRFEFLCFCPARWRSPDAGGFLCEVA